MDEYKMERYLAEVPYEIQDAIMSLSNKKNWAIFIALVKEGEKRFNEIKDQFGSDHSPEIDRALKVLIRGGLIEKVAHNPEEIGNAYKSFYKASETGIKFIDCLGNMLSQEPLKPIVAYPVGLEEDPKRSRKYGFFLTERVVEPIRPQALKLRYPKPMSAFGGSK